MRKSTREGITWRTVLEALEGGARDALSVAMACACAGIVIGVISLTGLGITFTQAVLALSQNSLFLALLLTAVAGIVLGMGMPTTPAYIVMVSLLVPALIKLGVATPAAHMFAFYFAVLSAITPPVALAVFAAAALAKANMWRAGFEAMRISAAGFIVPFMFAYEPALLAIGDWGTIALATFTATIGVMALAASLYGYLLAPLVAWQRLALVAAAFLLIKPGLVTDSIGLALLGSVAAMQWLARTRRPT
jgi:TRAP transporter 4TM/12TM fusion protein